MHRTVDFLRHIWSDTGIYALATIKKGQLPHHTFFNTFDEVGFDAYIDFANRHQLDSYMAIGNFNAPRRLAVNTAGFRSFFLDIDVGTKTPYSEPIDAIRALQTFCIEKGFPRPTALVGSGGGVHAYWATNEVVAPEIWTALSRKLVMSLPPQNEAMVDARKLFIKDPGCSTDAARIMRLPGTFNYKNAAPRAVSIIHLGSRIPLHQLTDVLGTVDGAARPVYHNYTTNEVSLAATLASVGSKPKSFRAILTKCRDGIGCPQIQYSVQNRATESEPSWRALLSIAKFCEDAKEAIHVVSQGHADYTPEDTEKKAAAIMGPYKCSSFDIQRPGICYQCPHQGRLTSPIQLGDLVVEAPVPVTVIDTVRPEPIAPVVMTPLTALLSNEPIPTKHTAVPYPYITATDGCTYRIVQAEEAKALTKQGMSLTTIGEHITVKEHRGHVTLLGRAYDPDSGNEVLHVAYKTGVDPTRISFVQTRDVGSFDTLRKTMSSGAIMSTQDGAFIQKFIAASQRADAHDRQAEPLLHKYGWYNNHSDFVYGNYVIKRDGTLTNALMRHIDSQSNTKDNPMRATGAPKHWVNMAEYWNRDEHLDLAFTLLSAFGAPLMSLLNMGVAGSLIHLFTPESGFGKSALQQMIMAAYGNATRLMFSPQDTTNALLNRIGTLSNVPIAIDEVTNLPAEKLSDLLYQMTQGREKLRMRQDYTGNMKPSGDWCTTIVTSGNASITDKLFAIKAAPEGELMRFLEIRPTSRLQGNVSLASVMEGINTNHGGIGAMYLYYIVTNRGTVVDLLNTVKTRLQQSKVLGEAQRFWLAQITCNIAGGLIAKQLGFIRYDLGAIEQWALDYVTKRANDLGQRKVKPTNVFNDMVGKFSSHIVVSPQQGLVAASRLNPLARIDYKSGMFSISLSALTQEASKYQVSVNDLMLGLQSDVYTYAGVQNVDITAGLPAAVHAPVTLNCAVYVFDANKLAALPDQPNTNNVVPMRR